MKSRWIRSLLILALALCVTSPAVATTLRRASLEDLAQQNDTIVVGEVVDAQSRWNADGTFILTDVMVAVDESLSGEASPGEMMTVTLLGGTVGDLTALIVAGAELAVGNSYVLFLNEETLPGAEIALTVRDHCQGVYDIILDRQDGLRAVSQASGKPLVPDAAGYTDAPGGTTGIPLSAMIETLHELVAARTPGGEVER